MKRQGFTLVELSIVLVIIGLLIGGILAAQSMIGTAKINSVAIQVGQFDAMVENFKTKYNALPGDAKGFGGDGDGMISRGPGNSTDVSVFDCEIINFWTDMDSTQYIANAYACAGVGGVQAISNGPSKNVPASKLGSNNSFFIASALANLDGKHADPNNIKNYYIILNASQFQSNALCCYFYTTTDATHSAVKPVDLLALDKKIDDGSAISGNILSGGSTGTNGGITTTPTNGICSDNTGKYLITDNLYECTPLIRIGASTGDLQ